MRFNVICLILLPLSGCLTSYDGLQGDVLNNDDVPHTYEVAITHTKQGQAQETWWWNATVAAKEKVPIPFSGDKEGGYAIYVRIDGTETAFGETVFTKNGGPGGFTIRTSDNQTRVQYWHN